MKKLFTLLTLALMSIGSAWADDVVSATQTFSSDRATCTWTDMSVTVAKNGTAGGDGLYFEAGSAGTITTATGVVNIKSGRTMYVQVPSASSTGTITIFGQVDKKDRTVSLNSGKTITMLSDGGSADFVATDVENVNGGYYIKVVSTSDFKFKSIVVTLDGSVYPESVAKDPEFSLTFETISTAGTSQIQVGVKGNLDGITFDGAIAYSKEGIVEVDENGVITPLAVGTTTITFSTVAVDGKYNASIRNSLTITVKEATLVYDATGLTNAEIVLNRANVDTYDYLESTDDSHWTDKGWSSPYDGDFLDWKSGRIITIKVKNVSSFELYVSGTAGRDYTIKVGDNAEESYVQTGDGKGYFTSGIIETGTTDEVTITLEGGANSLYPVYLKVNPTEIQVVPVAEYSTYVTTDALDFTGLDVEAYVAKAANTEGVVLEQVTSVPANTPLILKGIAKKSYFVPFAAATHVPESPSVNLLKAGDGTTTIGGTSKYDYVLNGGKFYRANEGTVAVGKAYLHLDAAPEAHELTLIFGDDVTGIQNVKVGTEDNVYYDLQGRRVLYPKKGLYIVNGKKVILK
ncbi:MAG: hypothetical protein IJ552_00550 [Prevotella sp.]|nr:hypothetical protein [Prevotella sp.]